MNGRRILTALAAVLLGALAWRTGGWAGLALLGSGLLLWLLLNYTRIMTIMKRAADRPVGYVGSAVMLNARLKQGMPLLDVLALTGASAAIMLSPLPFEGPVAGGRIGRINGQFVLNPTFEQQEQSDLNIVFAASADALTMVEGEARFVPEDVIIDALEWGRQQIQPLVEAQLKLRELAGKPKQKESLWVLLKSARQIKRVFGKVHVNFGEPLPLAEFLERSRPGWAGEDLTGADGWSREVTQGAALELARRINAAVVVNPVNLVALALLSTPRHTADEQVLDRVLAHYQALIAEAPYSTTIIPCHLAPPQIVSYVERLGIIERIAHPLGDLIRIPEGDASLLAYFRNNVLHVFALPALIACLINQNRHLDERRVNEAVVGIYGLMATELFLRWSSDELPAVTATVIDVLVRRGLLLRSSSGRLLAPESNSQEFAELRLLGETLRPILERHFLTLSLLQHYGTGRRTRRDLENDCHLLAGRLALLYDFNTPEYAEKATFSALIGNLIEARVLHEDETGLLHFDEQIGMPLAQAELVLPVEARQTIRRMASAGLAMPAETRR